MSEFDHEVLRSRIEDVIRQAADMPDSEHCANCALLQGAMTVSMLSSICADILDDAVDKADALDDEYRSLGERADLAEGAFLVLQEYLSDGLIMAKLSGESH